MNEYILNIHGIIGGYPTSKKDTTQYYSYADFLIDLNKIKKGSYDSITLDIASNGGYCDTADLIIKDLTALNIPISSRNSGNVCSAATKIFTLAEKSMRVFYPQFGLFLIHNPWAGSEGDASAHLEMAISLKETEMQYVKWYSNATGIDESIIESLMAEDMPLTNTQIEEFGFASVAIPKIQAFVSLTNNNNKIEENNMEDNKIIEKISVLEGLFKSFTKSFNPAKAELMLNDVNGIELKFPDISNVADIAIDSKVDVADGEYVMPDGSSIVVVGKVVTEIKPAEVEEQEVEVTIEAIMTPEEQKVQDDMVAENEALKVENEALKVELEKLKTDTSNTTAIVEEMKAEINSIKALSSTAKIETNTPEVEQPKNERVAGTWNRKK